MSENQSVDNKAFNVLWVDDNSLITLSSRLMIESLGHKCSVANSGKAALEYLNENPCDIVFTDIGMSEMSGWELMDAIRNKFAEEIKIAAATGWDIEESDIEKHGIDFVMQKPFTLEDLKKIFQAL